MTCPQCGTILEPTERFCYRCGAPMSDSQVRRSPPPAPPRREAEKEELAPTEASRPDPGPPPGPRPPQNGGSRTMPVVATLAMLLIVLSGAGLWYGNKQGWFTPKPVPTVPPFYGFAPVGTRVYAEISLASNVPSSVGQSPDPFAAMRRLEQWPVIKEQFNRATGWHLDEDLLNWMGHTVYIAATPPKAPPPPNAINDPQVLECQKNLELIGTALSRYSADHEGTFPAALKELVPEYLAELPQCPTAPASYGAGYSRDAKGATCEVACKGSNHTAAGLPADRPIFRSASGLEPPLRAPTVAPIPTSDPTSSQSSPKPDLPDPGAPPADDTPAPSDSTPEVSPEPDEEEPSGFNPRHLMAQLSPSPPATPTADPSQFLIIAIAIRDVAQARQFTERRIVPTATQWQTKTYEGVELHIAPPPALCYGFAEGYLLLGDSRAALVTAADTFRGKRPPLKSEARFDRLQRGLSGVPVAQVYVDLGPDSTAPGYLLADLQPELRPALDVLDTALLSVQMDAGSWKIQGTALPRPNAAEPWKSRVFRPNSAVDIRTPHLFGSATTLFVAGNGKDTADLFWGEALYQTLQSRMPEGIDVKTDILEQLSGEMGMSLRMGDVLRMGGMSVTDTVGGCAEAVRSIGLALDKYSLDHDGKYPATLGELVPNYLAELPRCPDNGVYEYVREEDAYRIYCKGETHAKAGVLPNHPQYSSRTGLDEGRQGKSGPPLPMVVAIGIKDKAAVEKTLQKWLENANLKTTQETRSGIAVTTAGDAYRFAFVDQDRFLLVGVGAVEDTFTAVAQSLESPTRSLASRGAFTASTTAHGPGLSLGGCVLLNEVVPALRLVPDFPPLLAEILSQFKEGWVLMTTSPEQLRLTIFLAR